MIIDYKDKITSHVPKYSRNKSTRTRVSSSPNVS